MTISELITRITDLYNTGIISYNEYQTRIKPLVINFKEV